MRIENKKEANRGGETSRLGFEDFRKRAVEDRWSPHEKIGFPDSHRAGRSKDIIRDIMSKLTLLNGNRKTVLDIGCGCGDLVKDFISFCEKKEHTLCLIDSKEMLDQVPGAAKLNICKVAGAFPENGKQAKNFAPEGFDVILTYSVVQYPFVEGNLWRFIDSAASLLKNGGQLLIGDIPNASMRNRFLSSPAGVKYHKKHYDPDTSPEIKYNSLPHDEIDDGAVFGILLRMRNAGFHAYVLPQDPSLPMANRREDILVIKP